MTLEQFLHLPDDGMHHELDSGRLIATPVPSFKHARVSSKLTFALSRFVRERRLGEVFENAGYQLTPDTVWQPDISFLSPVTSPRPSLAGTRGEVSARHGRGMVRASGSMARVEATHGRLVEGAPDLAIEIVSPSDSAEDLNRKIKQYLSAGAQAVWVIYPSTREVHVFETATSMHVLTAQDRLEAPGLFPGWGVPVADILV